VELDVDIQNKALVLDLLEWVADKPRTYVEVMEAWRTSCPRLPIWEDAVDLGLVVRTLANGAGPEVQVTSAGLALLQTERGAVTDRPASSDDVHPGAVRRISRE
jgi:hypothetical protein